MKPVLYIDIDGVLLTKNQTLPHHAEKFVSFISINFDCYWLTTHCKGDKADPLRYLKSYYSESLIHCVEKINATDWNTLKTEAINFKSNFLWIDDFVLESERQILEKNNCEKSLILIDLMTNPNALKTTMDLLESVNK